MSTQYDDLQGTEMPAHEHPDSNMQGTRATQLAGDVVPLRINPAPQPSTGLTGAGAQIVNQSSMRDIANLGSSAVDPTNLKLFKPK